MRELFIYYRLQRLDASTWQTRVLAAQRELCALHAGLQCRLLRHPESDEVWDTWMETYARPPAPDGVSLALQAEIESMMQALAGDSLRATASALPERHIEVFTPCA